MESDVRAFAQLHGPVPPIRFRATSARIFALPFIQDK